jgi:DNA-binding IclR family transcriptional regulator
MNKERSVEGTGPASSVERALSIFELVAQRSGGFTNSEISRRLEIPKSSASYILRVLDQRGYLQRDTDSGKYRLGLKLLGLAQSAMTGIDVREASMPVLAELVEQTRLNAHLAILDRGEVVYVAKAEAPGFIKVDTWVGRRNDAHSTSMGKAIMAYLPTDRIEEALGSGQLRKRTPKTITTRAALLKELERVRAQGYALDDEENSLGVRCIAAPVFGAAGAVVAAVNVSAATSQIDDRSIEQTVARVKEAARRLSVQLGGR